MFLFIREIVPFKNTHTSISIYNITDKEENNYYEYEIKIGNAIPLLGCSIIYKTNTPSINITLHKNKLDTHIYLNIKTCILSKDKIKPKNTNSNNRIF